jgi:hypothetical protein
LSGKISNAGHSEFDCIKHVLNHSGIFHKTAKILPETALLSTQLSSLKVKLKDWQNSIRPKNKLIILESTF